MLAGHKRIESEHLTFEFFPGTFFIPERGVVNTVTISNASIYNPTKCLVLELNPSFIKSLYEELWLTDSGNMLEHDPPEKEQTYFLSNDKLLLKAFTRLYDLQLQDNSKCRPLVEDLVIKEMLYRVFITDGVHLLKHSFEHGVSDQNIRSLLSYIKHNIQHKLSTPALAKKAGMGQTTFFKVFKESTGKTPAEYILHERIRQAKVMIQKGRNSLQEVAFNSGFNSYEYFCSSFKKIEGLKPSQYRRKQELAHN